MRDQHLTYSLVQAKATKPKGTDFTATGYNKLNTQHGSAITVSGTWSRSICLPVSKNKHSKITNYSSALLVKKTWFKKQVKVLQEFTLVLWVRVLALVSTANCNEYKKWDNADSAGFSEGDTNDVHYFNQWRCRYICTSIYKFFLQLRHSMTFKWRERTREWAKVCILTAQHGVCIVFNELASLYPHSLNRSFTILTFAAGFCATKL